MLQLDMVRAREFLIIICNHFEFQNYRRSLYKTPPQSFLLVLWAQGRGRLAITKPWRSHTKSQLTLPLINGSLVLDTPWKISDRGLTLLVKDAIERTGGDMGSRAMHLLI